MKRNNLLLFFVFLIFICHIPIANAATFDYGVVISEYRHYEPPFTTSDFYFMLGAAEVDTNSYPVYVQNIPGASVDTSLTYMPGWDDLTPYIYARGFVSPPPGGDWENRTYTFYIDLNLNSQKDQGEPTTTWNIPQGSISQMALVQNVSISAGYNPTITWDPAPNADTYRIRFVPIKDGNPDFSIGLFQSDEFSESSSYSYTYTGNLFKDYGPIAIVIEAWEDYNDLMINRSRYIVQHDPGKKIMPSIPLLLLDEDKKLPVSGIWTGSSGFGDLSFTVNSTSTGITQIIYHYIDFSCGISTYVDMTHTHNFITPLSITDSQFTHEYSSSGLELTLSGTFGQTGMSASGTYKAVVDGTICQGNWDATPN